MHNNTEATKAEEFAAFAYAATQLIIIPGIAYATVLITRAKMHNVFKKHFPRLF